MCFTKNVNFSLDEYIYYKFAFRVFWTTGVSATGCQFQNKSRSLAGTLCDPWSHFWCYNALYACTLRHSDIYRGSMFCMPLQTSPSEVSMLRFFFAFPPNKPVDGNTTSDLVNMQYCIVCSGCRRQSICPDLLEPYPFL